MMQDIKIQFFCSLSQDSQCELLYKHGVYIGKQKIGNTALVLFQLNGFYVEVVYNKYRQNIKEMNCSASVSIADPYLIQVNVEELVNVPD